MLSALMLQASKRIQNRDDIISIGGNFLIAHAFDLT
jgi:hypothetical protein